MEEKQQQTPPELARKRVGAPKGKQNARKHGFYSDVLDDEEYEALKRIRGYDDLDGEIDLMRVKIQSIARHDPNNVRLLIEATNSVARLMKTREKLSVTGRNKMRNGIANVWRELAPQLMSEETRKRVLTRLANGKSASGRDDEEDIAPFTEPPPPLR